MGFYFRNGFHFGRFNDAELRMIYYVVKYRVGSAFFFGFRLHHTKVKSASVCCILTVTLRSEHASEIRNFRQ